jgi:predicted RNA binding protein YcfA (HicA-like mRNA interferase family)
MKTKVGDKKTLIEILEKEGFVFKRHNKHAVYVKGDKTAVIPNRKKGFSRMCAERVLKDVGLM